MFASDDGDWWAGVQQCAVFVALATVVSITSNTTASAEQVFDYQQDDPAGNLATVSAPPDEVYWRNPVFPVPASHFLRFPAQLDPDLIPAGKLATVSAPPDEVYWRNPVFPVPASHFLRFPAQLDPDLIPAGKLATVSAPPDDTSCKALVAPAQSTMLAPSQAIFDEQFPKLYGQYDEDFQCPIIPPQTWAVPPSAFTYDDVIVPQPNPFSPDEDLWRVTIPQVVTQSGLYLPDPENIPAGSLYGQFDEDFWVNPVAPISASLYQKLPLGDVEEIPAGSLYGVQDDINWPVVSIPSWSYFVPNVFSTDEVVAPQVTNIINEDYWYQPTVQSSDSIQQHLLHLQLLYGFNTDVLNVGVNAQIGQEPVQVIFSANSPNAQIGQLAVQVLFGKPNIPYAEIGQLVVQVMRKRYGSQPHIWISS